jgi:hypothetical protein
MDSTVARRSGEKRKKCQPSHPAHEALQVYGQALEELIHEEFGDGIMSAINFKVYVQRRADPGGDRVVVTLDGKFLDLSLEDSEEINQRVKLKLKRQGLITRKNQPAALDVVLLECAIRRLVGSPMIMAAQLRHIADVSTRPNVRVRVLPFRAGISLGDPMGPFIILDFGIDKKGKPIEPTVVYLESFTGDMYLEKPVDVRRYDEAHQAIRNAALDETASRTLLRVAREFAS